MEVAKFPTALVSVLLLLLFVLPLLMLFFESAC
jgi:hypothetical protein